MQIAKYKLLSFRIDFNHNWIYIKFNLQTRPLAASLNNRGSNTKSRRFISYGFFVYLHKFCPSSAEKANKTLFLDSRESADVKTAVVFPGLERMLQVELINTHLHHETFSNRPTYCGLNSGLVTKPSIRFWICHFWYGRLRQCNLHHCQQPKYIRQQQLQSSQNRKNHCRRFMGRRENHQCILFEFFSSLN